MEMTYDEKTSVKQKDNLILTYFVTLAGAIVTSFFMHSSWIRYINVYHTILELFCVFIALSIFLSSWYNYQRISFSKQILGFGFLTVAVFDALHTFYFLRLDLTASSYFDLSTRYWIIGRLVEAIVILILVRDINLKANVGKLWALVITLIITLGAICFLNVYHDYLPVLLTDKGVTPIKVVLEYLVILLCTISLYMTKKKLNSDENIQYKYIFLSLLTMIPSEILFTLYSDVSSVVWTIGHVLKIVSYYFLFKGIYVSSIIYSYIKLEAHHEEVERAHEEIKAMTDTLNDILDSLPTAVYMYDENSRIKYVNKKFEELFGCSKNDICGMTTERSLSIIIPKENEPRLLTDRVLEGDITASKIVKTYRTLYGEYKKLSITSQKISGGAIALIREAKEEQELSNLNLQTEAILNSVSNCVLMIDNNKNIVLCNKALEELVGIDKTKLIGMNIDELNKIINFDAQYLTDIMLQEDADEQVYEASLITPGGSKKEIIIYLSAIKNVEGEVIGGISVSTDVTEQKKEQLKIQQQEKLALLGQLGAGIVHETRNFLTTIKGRCQLVEFLAEEPKLKEYAKKINNDMDEINRIISEFLFLSKPRETELEEVSMYDIVQSIKNIVETSSLVRGVDVGMEVSREERYLMCDEVQIKQVILNICKNAVDAMAGVECPKLSIVTGYNEDNNEMFIRIADNGAGMTEEQLDKIGTMFYTTKKTGTGLGLNVCYQIIKEHKGRIEVESKLGEGTIFTVVIPCIDDEELEDVI
ncbi:PAS domain S-box protein [Clostridium swellfunianum]|uniref:MASE3 domain-containing protein n=1 Tax=Clostridium swellfunianum TaxID=1367462 RepID=UPI0020306FB5|nr:MASE3 domain-containing protein [Clostridium swellfunianum]MCM0647119.1 PAS domain S-box protein [Clostridium swellfunianum]